MKKCNNCKWIGKKDTRPYYICPNCGDDIIDFQSKTSNDLKEDLSLDLNNDGKIDQKDASIASKVMNAVKKKKSSKTKSPKKKNKK